MASTSTTGESSKRSAEAVESPSTQGQAHTSAKRPRPHNQGDWLVHDPLFKSWASAGKSDGSSIPPVLWLRGPPGSGKSFLSQIAVRELQNSFPTRPVLGHFCDAYSTPGSIVRDLMAQLGRHPLVDPAQRLEASGVLAESLGAGVDEGASQLWDQLARTSTPLTLVVDGLDEIPSKYSEGLQQSAPGRLALLAERDEGDIKILFSSRVDPNIRAQLEKYPAIDITPEKVEEDLAEYLSGEVRRHERLQPLADKIIPAVVKQAEGIFLWAGLFVRSLSLEQDERAVMGALEHPSPVLNDVFARIFVRMAATLSPLDIQLRDTILRWVASSVRPISTTELMNVLLLELNAFIPDIETRGADICGSLISVENGVVKPFHASLGEYLKSDHPEVESTTHFAPGDAHGAIARLCVGYLSHPSFSSGEIWDATTLTPSEVSSNFPFLEYATLYWINHVTNSVKEDRISSAIEAFVNTPNFLVWADSLLPLFLSKSVLPVPPRPKNSARFFHLFFLKSQLLGYFPPERKDAVDSLVCSTLEASYKSHLDVAKLHHGGPSHQAIQRMLDLSEVYGWLRGRRPEATALVESALESAGSTLSSDDPLMFVVKQAVADDYKRNGRYQDSIDILSSLIATLRTVDPTPDGLIMFAHDSLGWAQSKLGRHEEAAESLQTALSVARKLYGVASPVAQRTEITLAESLVKCGRAEEAGPLCKQLEDQLGESKGSGQPLPKDVVSGLNTLAAVYRAQDRYADARDVYATVVDERTKLFGKEHPMSLWATLQLALVRKLCGEEDLAKELLRELIPLQEKVLGAEHPDVAEARKGLEE